MFRKTSTWIATLGMLLSGCSTFNSEGVSGVARPNQAPTPSTTQFEQPLQCMDEMFSDYGVSGVTIAVTGVPDFTGRAFVGSDFWLQTAISKMSQRSGAFRVTDYNPNQLAPEQGLWTLSNKSGFYIPAYYIRGAISGFANNVVENTANVGVGTPLANGGGGVGAAYSTVSVDLTVGNLMQRTLINRAHAGNEIVLQSKSAGAQVGGLIKKFGANFEVNASRNDGVPQAVRALVELNGIEILGRLTGAPYWQCLGAEHTDPAAAKARKDIFFDMSAPERVVFVQRRLARLGYFQGQLDGMPTATLGNAVKSYRADRGLSASPAVDFPLYERMTDWRSDKGSYRQQASLSAPVPQPEPQAAPKQEKPAAPVAKVASLPQATERDPSVRPLSFNLALMAPDRRPGGQVFFNLSSSSNVFAYCYLQDASGAVARIFPNRFQPDPLVKSGDTVSVPPNRSGTFDLVLPAPGTQENVSCFASTKEIGRGLPAKMAVEDLVPIPVQSLEKLGTIFEENAKQLKGDLVVEKTTLSSQ